MPYNSLLNAKPQDYVFEPAQADQLRLEQGAYGERFRSPVAPQQQALVSTAIEQVCRPTILLEIIFYSKIHLVTPDEFVQKAKDYHKILRDETLLLYNDIKDNRKIYQEWADPDGFIESAVANSTAAFAAATDAVVGLFKAVKRAPKPDINEFDKLIERTTKIAYDVNAAAGALTYENIHAIGIHLALIREDSRRLYKAVDLFRNRAIDSAETITRGLETAEGASFQVLALVPTLTGMDPLREAAYRISLIVLRAGGRSAGAALGETEGLVTKPSTARPIRPDNESAVATWEKNVKSIKENGAMVREDGVVFHPDMLRDAAKADPANSAPYQRAAQILTELQAKGHFDLTSHGALEALHQSYPHEAAAVRQLLQQARIGYYPDLDLAEVFDANTGDRIPVGAGNEKDPAELAYLQRNRSNLDQTVNINDDVRNIPPEARGPDGKPRVSLDNTSPHVQSLFQHGADNEYYKPGAGGPIGVIGPDGRKWYFKDRNDFEAGMRTILGQKYRDPGQRNVRGILMTKNSKDDPTSGARAKGSGERIDTAKFNRIRWYYERVRQDAPGAGTPVPPHDIWMSLFQRGLSIEPHVFALAPGGRWNELHPILQRHGTFAAIDHDAKNLIIAGATPESFANGLARLARTAQDLGALAVPNLTVWFELYSSYKPVTSDYILNRIGGPDPGVSSALDDVRSAVTAFAAKPGQQMYAFALDGFHPTYSPPSPTPIPPRPDQLPPADRNRLYREHTVGSFGLQPPNFGKVEGQKVLAVWDNLTTRKLTFEEVKILGRPVAIFTAGLAACPADVEPMEIPDLIQRTERPALLVS